MRDKDAALLLWLVPAPCILVCEPLHSVFLFTYELERRAVGAWVGRMKVRNSNSEYFSFLNEKSQAAQSKYSNPHIISSVLVVFLALETLQCSNVFTLVACYRNHQSYIFIIIPFSDKSTWAFYLFILTMADVTSTFCLMKLTEWTFTRALECHTSKLIKKVRWSYSCVYLCALDLAEMFGGIRIKSKCGDGGGLCNLKLFHSAIFSHLTEAVFLHIGKKNPKHFALGVCIAKRTALGPCSAHSCRDEIQSSYAAADHSAEPAHTELKLASRPGTSN